MEDRKSLLNRNLERRWIEEAKAERLKNLLTPEQQVRFSDDFGKVRGYVSKNSDPKKDILPKTPRI